MNDTHSPKVLIRLTEVLKLAPVAKCTLYSWMAKGAFPRPINLGGRAVAWDLAAVTEWQAQRIKVSE
jgi:prophage regulatory protein